MQVLQRVWPHGSKCGSSLVAENEKRRWVAVCQLSEFKRCWKRNIDVQDMWEMSKDMSFGDERGAERDLREREVKGGSERRRGYAFSSWAEDVDAKEGRTRKGLDRAERREEEDGRRVPTESRRDDRFWMGRTRNDWIEAERRMRQRRKEDERKGRI
jgi:hypothetical protein